MRCGMSCSKDKFSCTDGGCVSWTLTCNGEKNCEDGTDEPSFCKIFLGTKLNSTNCSLLNVGCALSENKDIIARQVCAANQVKCDFEVGFCGMKHESTFHRWQIASSFTLTKSTGPPFDHTTFSTTGKSHESNSGKSCPPPQPPCAFCSSQDNQKATFSFLFNLL